MSSNQALYLVTLVLLAFSWSRDRAKTRQALHKAWKSLENILPEFLGVILLVGVLLAVLNPAAVSSLIGRGTGWWGVTLAALVGAITLIPGFVAFPMVALLRESGAGAMQIGAFVSSLMMVGVVTLPVEMKFFGRRLPLLRNTLAFVFSFLVALIIGKVVNY